ncbi:hypothetical protein Trydic_g20299 [Trypoxylus dichotomus]
MTGTNRRSRCYSNRQRMYVTRQRDSTSLVVRQTNRLVKVSSFPDDMKKHVTVTEALPPRLYGLPKIHKRNISLRPTMSAIGAPTYIPVNKTPNYTTATIHRRKT